ncbi:MAG TPA: hypothetical protein VJ939_06270 [Bacteroidales bacterium]|nr:hypothetical protein [Bacteroidales bacterium]
MKKIYVALFVTISVLLTVSCDKNNDDLIPSYIRIDTVMVKGNPDINEGTLSHNITDAWVYIDDELIGTFELPATFPVLKEGEVDVVIKAGIKLNGVSSTRVPYPFYTDYVMNGVSLEKKEITTLIPEVTYQEESIIPWRESFEDNDFRLVEKGDTSVFLTPVQEAFEGSGSGRVIMDMPQGLYEATSDTGYVLPRNGSPVFLEMNFKTNHPVTVGVYADNPAINNQKALVILNPTPFWKKIYINITSTVLSTPEATSYRIFYGTTKVESEETAVIDVDNLKLIHY